MCCMWCVSHAFGMCISGVCICCVLVVVSQLFMVLSALTFLFYYVSVCCLHGFLHPLLCYLLLRFSVCVFVVCPCVNHVCVWYVS